MAIVELKPGDKVCVYRGCLMAKGTTYQMNDIVTYENLCELLNSKKSAENKKWKSKSVGTKLSRGIGLFSRAMLTGCWATGHEISKEALVARFIAKMEAVKAEDYATITSKAKIALDNAICQLVHLDFKKISHLDLEKLMEIRKRMGYE